MGERDAAGAVLDRVLAGDEGAVAEAVRSLRAAGAPPLAVAVGLLDPLLVETGRRWAEARVSVGQEHLVTALCGRALADLAAEVPSPEPPRGAAVVGCAPGERHCLGARAVALALRGAGWAVAELGPDAAPGAFEAAVAEAGATLAGVSVATPQRVPAAAALVARLKDGHPDLRVLVGGRAAAPGLFPGADLVAGRDLGEALRAAAAWGDPGGGGW